MVKSANTKAKSRPARKGRPLMSRKSVAAAVVGIASVINACMSPNAFERERSADVQTPLKNAIVSVDDHEDVVRTRSRQPLAAPALPLPLPLLYRG